MQNNAYIEISPWIQKTFEDIERDSAKHGRAVEIHISTDYERRPKKDYLLSIYVVDPTKNGLGHTRAIIPCRVSQLSTVAVAMYLTLCAVEPDDPAEESRLAALLSDADARLAAKSAS